MARVISHPVRFHTPCKITPPVISHPGVCEITHSRENTPQPAKTHPTDESHVAFHRTSACPHTVEPGSALRRETTRTASKIPYRARRSVGCPRRSVIMLRSECACHVCLVLTPGPTAVGKPPITGRSRKTRRTTTPLTHSLTPRQEPGEREFLRVLYARFATRVSSDPS